MEGEDSVGANIGIGGKAKGKKGCWITLAEYKYDKEKKRYIPLDVQTKKIDGKKIKSDTWYQLVNGKFQVAK